MNGRISGSMSLKNTDWSSAPNAVRTTPGCSTVAVTPLPRVLLLTLQVVEVQVAERMRAGGHGNDPGRCAGLEPIQQQVGEQERREVIERERVLREPQSRAALSPRVRHPWPWRLRLLD